MPIPEILALASSLSIVDKLDLVEALLTEVEATPPLDAESMEKALEQSLEATLPRPSTDPVAVELNQVVIGMADRLIEVKKLLAAAIGDEKRLAKTAEEAAAGALEWERRATLAVKAGDDALAAETRARKAQCEKDAGAYRKAWIAQKELTDELKTGLRELNGEVEAAKRRCALMMVGVQRARARQLRDSLLRSIKNGP
jgi:phage shock protein A